MIQRPQPPEVPEISPRHAWEESRTQRAIIVDVREPDEVAEIAVPGAMLVPLGQLSTELAQIPRDQPVLFLCRSGYRSAYATAFYQQQTGAEAANIVGGILAWHEAGLPTSQVAAGAAESESD